MSSFVFHFHKKWKTKNSSFFVFHFHEKIEKKNDLRSRLTLWLFSQVWMYMLFTSKFVSSPLRFSAVQWSSGHQESAA